MLKVNPRLPKFLRTQLNYLFHRFSPPKWVVFMLDFLAIYFTFIFAYLLRYNLAFNNFPAKDAFHHGVVAVAIYAAFSLIFRSYSVVIRHTTIVDVINVLISNSFSMLALFCLSILSRIFELNVNTTIPFSIILIHFVSITVFLIIVKITIKFFYLLVTKSSDKKNKVLIYGPVEMGVVVKRVIMSDLKNHYDIFGFIDRDRKLQGKNLNGIPVFNPAIFTMEFLIKNEISTLIFAIKDISSGKKSEVIRLAMEAGLEILETPPVDKWLNGQLQISQIRKVKLSDLLGRDCIHLNMDLIGDGLQGKVILVTGAAGSIGSEMMRQLIRFPVKNLILLDQAETPMYHIQNELNEKPHPVPIQFILADVTNKEKMEDVFQKFRPDIVFHAAAYKHVPLMEENPHESVRVNIGGTHIITNLAVKYGVQKFVMISTDKVINPTNIMGASKRVCELIVQAKSKLPENATQFVITRFGNVLGSNGSVIPRFSKQIEEGGPVTVTHPEITRYFMTIPEACQLVLEAGFMGKGGEIFVFDMGEPVKIIDLANQMIRLSGLIPGKDIKIVFIGLRPGEKLYEELLADREKTIPTHHPKIMIARVANIENDELIPIIEKLTQSIYKLTKQEVLTEIKNLVPEYVDDYEEKRKVSQKSFIEEFIPYEEF